MIPGGYALSLTCAFSISTTSDISSCAGTSTLNRQWSNRTDAARVSTGGKSNCRVNYKPQIFRQHLLIRQQKAAKITVVDNKMLIIDDLGFVPLLRTGSELLFEVFSQRYERGSTLLTTNLPFCKWTEMFGSERLTGALLDRLTHHVHILEMNGESYRLRQSSRAATTSS